MKIFIANLPHKMDEAELKQLLTQFGQVSSVKLATDKDSGKRKGFGFIEMPVYDQAQTAIQALNGKIFYGRAITLTVAEEKQPSARDFSKAPRREAYSDKNDAEVDGNKW